MREAVIFDLDGTLTEPNLDFDQIRAEIGIEAGPILEAIARMDEARRIAAERILNRHERQAAENASLRPGAVDTVASLRNDGFRVGVLTRNARPWSQHVLQRFGLQVDGLHCREDGAIKPDPHGVLALCERFQADPQRSWMIGDYLFDIVAGRGAGLQTVLLVDPGAARPDFADTADYTIEALCELIELVKKGRTRDN